MGNLGVYQRVVEEMHKSEKPELYISNIQKESYSNGYKQGKLDGETKATKSFLAWSIVFAAGSLLVTKIYDYCKNQNKLSVKAKEVKKSSCKSSRKLKRNNVHKGTNEEKRMTKYKIILDGEEQDEVFTSEKDAEEYALDLCSATCAGAEELHRSNPGDYDYDEASFESPKYEIVEID